MFYLTDFNECSRDKYYCHQFATCTNYRGSFKCICNIQQGFNGDGFECYNFAGMNNIITFSQSMILDIIKV